MRKAVFALVLASLAVGPVLAAKAPAKVAKPAPAPVKVKAPALALPPGAKVLTEINLDQQALLDMIKQAIPAFAQGVGNAEGPVGDAVRQLNMNDLLAAIKGIKAIRFVHYGMSQVTDPNAVLAGMERQLTSAKGWERILYNATDKKGTVAVYSLAGKQFALVQVGPKGDKTSILTTSGFVDVPKLASWLGRAAATLPQLQPKPPTEQPNPQAEQPTPQTPPTATPAP